MESIDNCRYNPYNFLAEMQAATRAMHEARTYLENQIAQSQGTPFLPLTMEGEGEMAQIKDRLQVIKPDGTTKIEWVSGINKQAFFDNLVLAYAKNGMLERLGIHVVKLDLPVKETDKLEQKQAMQTFKQYVDSWFEAKKQTVGMNTLKGYLSAFNAHLFPNFGKMPMDDITWMTIQNFLNDNREMAKETLRDYLKKLRVVFASAMEDGIITVNPAKNRQLKNPGKVNLPREALTEQQRYQIARILPTIEERDARYVAICLYAATRKSEALGLQWKHVTEDEIQVRQQCQVNNKSIILPPKSDCGVRDIPIQERLKPYLANRGAEQEYLFGKGTKPPTKYMFDQMLKRIKSHLQGIGISSHILRHTFITECAEEDVPVNVTQKIAGHSKPSITYDVYTHVTEKMKQNAMKKLNSL